MSGSLSKDTTKMKFSVINHLKEMLFAGNLAGLIPGRKVIAYITANRCGLSPYLKMDINKKDPEKSFPGSSDLYKLYAIG